MILQLRSHENEQVKRRAVSFKQQLRKREMAVQNELLRGKFLKRKGMSRSDVALT